MKTKILRGWRWTLAVCSTVAFLGCLDRTTGTGAQTEIDAAGADTVAVSNVSESELSKVDSGPVHVAIPPANLSPGIAELVKLAQSGVGEEVLRAYVQSAQSFNPTVDEIIYLKDLGVPDSVVAEAVRKGNLPDEVAKTVPDTNIIESAPMIDPPLTNFAVPGSGAPSLTEPAAPSYSVTADPAYNDGAVPQQVTINYFESALAPYGTWVDVPDYGRCWQPTVYVINRNWRPYSDRGRWIYTSSGWYWQSDYSWGWAPFHYGRWHHDTRIGWVWVPGSVWGPAWVTWRYTDQYCGWAPLPPHAYYDGFGFRYHSTRVGINFSFGLRDDCFTFIPVNRFCDRTPHRYFVSRAHSTTIFKNSVVINNYIRINNTIVNEGIGRDRIAKATPTPIKTVALRDLPKTGTPPVGRVERMEGNSLSVFRPNVAAHAGATSTSPLRTQFSGGNSVGANVSASQNPAAQSSSPNRNIRSITRTETPSTTVPAQTPAVTAPATQPSSATIIRGSSPSTITRGLPSRVPQQQPAPSPVIPSTAQQTPSSPAPSGVIRQNIASPTIRTLPAQNQAQHQVQEPIRTIPGRENIAPAETPRVPQRTIPTIVQTPQPVQTPPSRVIAPTPAPTVRSQPTFQAPQSQPQPQPAPRDRRQEFFDQRNSSGSLRSIPSAPSAPSAPAQVQNFSPPPQNIQRESPRFERSIPQRNEPAPSPSVSAPRESAPAPRAQEAPPSRDRSIGRPGRN